MAPAHPYDVSPDITAAHMTDAQVRQHAVALEKQIAHLRQALTEIRWTTHEKDTMEYAKQALAATHQGK